MSLSMTRNFTIGLCVRCGHLPRECGMPVGTIGINKSDNTYMICKVCNGKGHVLFRAFARK